MKNLLTVLSAIVLGSTVASPLISQNINSINEQDKYVSKTFYWKDNHSDLSIVNTYSRNTQIWRYFIHTISISSVNIEGFSTASIYDPTGTSYTKSSWGNDAYWGDKPSIWKNRSVKDLFWKGKVTSHADISAHIYGEILSAKDHQGFASFYSRHLVGFSYYNKNGTNYIQVFGLQYVIVEHSYSGGAMWTDVGAGIEFNW